MNVNDAFGNTQHAINIISRLNTNYIIAHDYIIIKKKVHKTSVAAYMARFMQSDAFLGDAEIVRNLKRASYELINNIWMQLHWHIFARIKHNLVIFNNKSYLFTGVRRKQP